MHFPTEHDVGTVFAGSRSVHGAAFFLERVSELCHVELVPVACVSVTLGAFCFATTGTAGGCLEGQFRTLTVVLTIPMAADCKGLVG